MESKLKHLEFIQNTINRLANNSSLAKGWAITIITALFAFSGNDEIPKRVLIAYTIILLFWLIDSYFLAYERLYRAKYDDVRKLQNNKIDFNLSVKKISIYNLDPLWSAFLSFPLLMYYLPLMAITIGMFYWLK